MIMPLRRSQGHISENNQEERKRSGSFNKTFSAGGFILGALNVMHIYPFLMHDIQNFFIAEDRVFLFNYVDDAVTADIKGIRINLAHNVPTGAGRFVCRTLPGIFWVALHNFPTGPICIQ